MNYDYKIDEEEYDLKIAKEDFASPLIQDLNRLELFKKYYIIIYIFCLCNIEQVKFSIQMFML